MGYLGNMDRPAGSSTHHLHRLLAPFCVASALWCGTASALTDAQPPAAAQASAETSPEVVPSASDQAPSEASQKTLAPTSADVPPEALVAEPANTSAEAPYQPYEGHGYGKPGALEPDDLPPPLLPHPPHLRRVAELIPQIGFAVPTCSSGDPETDRCVGLKSGVGVGLAGLWRVVPRFAVGLGIDVAALRNDPPKRLGLSDESALAMSIALVSRLYFLDEGSLDPYVDLSLGAGVLGASAREADGFRYDETGAGFLTGLGAGLDFFVGSQLRLGPFLSYSHTFVRYVRRCSTTGGDECTDLATDTHGLLHGVFQMGLRFSILIGNEY